MRTTCTGVPALLRVGLGGLAFIIVLSTADAAAVQPFASLPAPINANPLQYSSPYGPRFLFGGYDFHPGVDYKYGKGTPIHAVQGGTVAFTGLDGLGDWYIAIQGGPNDAFPAARFSYIHIFDNSWTSVPEDELATDPDGNVIYASATADPSALSLIELITLEKLVAADCFAIVFWTKFNANIPAYALSECEGFPVGDPDVGVVTTSTVFQEEMIAVVGDSGIAAKAFHLHLQVNSGAQNPLLYVQHDNSNPPGYQIAIFKDKGTNHVELDENKVELGKGVVPDVLDPMTDSPLRVRTEIDYHQFGHDLDQVHIVMFKVGTPEPPLIGATEDTIDLVLQCISEGRCITFNYGGRLPNSNVPRNKEDIEAAIALGLYPQLGKGGVVDFLTFPIDLTTLDPGDYIILVRAYNVVGGVESQMVTVSIPPPGFQVAATCTVVSPAQFVDPTIGYRGGKIDVSAVTTAQTNLLHPGEWVSVSALTTDPGKFELVPLFFSTTLRYPFWQLITSVPEEPNPNGGTFFSFNPCINTSPLYFPGCFAFQNQFLNDTSNPTYQGLIIPSPASAATISWTASSQFLDVPRCRLAPCPAGAPVGEVTVQAILFSPTPLNYFNEIRLSTTTVACQ